MKLILLAAAALAGGGINGDIHSDSPQRALGFTFNLTNLPANTGIRITGIRITSVTALNDGGGDTGNVQVVVDGVSVTALGGLGGTGLSIDVTNGDLLAFRNVGTGISDYRLRSITFDTYTIPEPSSAMIAMLGCSVLRLRRRR